MSNQTNIFDQDEWRACPSDADRITSGLRCPGAVPVGCNSPTGYACWWCGDACSPPGQDLIPMDKLIAMMGESA